jgi:hypothetical protein
MGRPIGTSAGADSLSFRETILGSPRSIPETEAAQDPDRSNNGVRSWPPSSTRFTAKLAGNI